MNDLILLMWLADVVGSIAVVGIFVCIAFTLAFVIKALVISTDYPQNWTELGMFKMPAIIMCVALFIAVVLPNKATIHAIVAIKAGEQLASSDIGKKSIEALEAVLDRVIDDKKKKGGE